MRILVRDAIVNAPHSGDVFARHERSFEVLKHADVYDNHTSKNRLDMTIQSRVAALPVCIFET
jgi:hypothetical protein